MACPLCDEKHYRASWLGATLYNGREFPYVECLACNSLYCEPMPDEETLAQMYGPSYAMSFSPDPAIEDPKEPQRVLDWLARIERGTFIDYGCGEGKLLQAAADSGWDVLGIEFDDDVVRGLAERTGLRTMTSQAALDSEPIADALHLGDVIEHMTNINEQMPVILKLIKPGGLLIAQGPLEANFNVFTIGLRLSRSLRPNAKSEIAPYHVMLATKQGQEECFRRFDLAKQEFDVTEVTWPAPARLLRSDLAKPRAVGLFALRRLSQAISSIQSEWGNRYFYVGRRGEH